MKYSVIVPYWNSEEWLGRCCNSLSKQKGDFEFILVNDNSTDTSEAIALAYAEYDSRFVLYDNERTKGVSGARNTGLEHAQGEWITFLDADDEYVKDAWEAFEITLETKARIHQLNHIRYYTEIDKTAMKMANSGGWYYVDKLPECWFGVWNKLYHRSVVENVRFDESIQYGEDGLFVLATLAADHRIHHADKRVVAVIHRFDNKASLSHMKTGKALLEQIHTYEGFMLRQTDPMVRVATIKEISNLWAHPRVEKLLGVNDGTKER